MFELKFLAFSNRS